MCKKEDKIRDIEEFYQAISFTLKTFDEISSRLYFTICFVWCDVHVLSDFS